ncbi:unnamed protein product [Ectocarpus fasciculatus]
MLEVAQEDDEFDLAGSARLGVLVSAIKPRQASQIVKDLSELLPLERAKLNHLKRIRSSQHPETGRLLQVLLSPPDMYHALDEAKRKDIVERYGLEPTVHAVPKLEPRTRAQFLSGGSAWPMIFHHSTSEEARRAARVIPEQDAVDAIAFMREALVDAETARQQNGGRPTVGAVLVDPLGLGSGDRRGRVVATASRERQKVRDEEPASMRDHPLHHAVMLCVQGVGRALAAGSKQEKLAREQEEDSAGGKLGKDGEGIGSETLCSDADPAGGVVEVLSPKQYLCTGFDLYVTREPCLMCAMALVHSRVRRVIYGVRDTERGCLGSVTMLHTLTSLNHNYRVFEGVCADECRQSLSDSESEHAVVLP